MEIFMYIIVFFCGVFAGILFFVIPDIFNQPIIKYRESTPSPTPVFEWEIIETKPTPKPKRKRNARRKKIQKN